VSRFVSRRYSMWTSFVHILPVFMVAHRGMGLRVPPHIDLSRDGDGVCDEQALDQLYRSVADTSVKMARTMKYNGCATRYAHALKNFNGDAADVGEVLPSRKWLKFTKSNECKKELPPKLLIVGLPHAGTTELAERLNAHPKVSYGAMKEHLFFYKCFGTCDTTSEWMEKMKGNFFNQFIVDCDVDVTFDASPLTFALGNENIPNGTALHGWYGFTTGPAAMQRIKDTLGDDLKVIFIVRDPVDFIDAWVKSRVETWETSDKEPVACYADSMQAWIDLVGRKNIKFLDYAKNIDDNIGETVDDIFKWVGVPPRGWVDKIASDVFNSSGRRRTQHDDVPMSKRMDFHANPSHQECKKRLEELSGQQFDWQGSV